MQIKVFSFNPLGVNTYLLWDETGDGALIDVGCSSGQEFEALFSFIERENIQIRHLLVTHPHFDHIYGAKGSMLHFGLPLEMHEKAVSLIGDAVEAARMWGFDFDDFEGVPSNKTFVEGDIIEFGTSQLEVLYTPGHCEGSVCFVSHSDKTVFSGDVLFRESIGRTDFPTGDYDLLRDSIYNKLFTLEDCYTVRSGHGGRTTIGHERYNNPLL
ncbi:MAG: MBL fold metallo-hydrolase [Bacteroidales bacterium]|jgi:glyoxylase-like metal-dependent hydrolase (beta-lactamase superfamily II)|nr:MBL fold metallo-hydrolase [Bacteroidales bacterium]